jgi:heptosyltransferase-3
MELKNVRHIAVLKMRNIGDVLMATPALRALRETFPEARITVFVNSGTEAMLARNPHIDEVVIYQRHEAGASIFRRLAAELRFLRALRRGRFDLVIGFGESDRTAWSTLFTGARYRLGTPHYSHTRYAPVRFAYNLPVPASTPRMHEVRKHFFILEKGGLELRNKEPGPLCLVVDEETRAWARRQLAPLADGPIIHIHPVARWLWKCWRSDYMAEVIDWLQTQRGARVVVTTGPVEEERRRAQEIVRLGQTKPLFFDGNVSLAQIAALSAEADCYFGVDTAPMHMAAAVGTPVIALFGPTVEAVWAPWTEDKCVLSHRCLCHKTRMQACDWTQVRACLAQITPDEARAALDQRLFATRSVAT